MPHIYDSGDPGLPDLPHEIDFTNESDEFSDVDNKSSHTDDEHNGTRKPLKRRGTKLFDDHKFTGTPQGSHEDISSNAGTTTQAQPIMEPSSLPPTTSKKRRRRRKNRKYSDSAYSSTAARQRISWEPGIDINTTDVIISSIGSAVTITDYSDDRYRVEHIEVKTNILEDVESEDIHNNTSSERPYTPQGAKVKASVTKLKSALSKRPPWSKVRWINVNGLSWEAIAAIGEQYNLHRLAIEDMIDIPQRTKIDVYPGHIFGVLPLIKLVRDTHADSSNGFQVATLWDKFLQLLNLYDYNEHGNVSNRESSETNSHHKETLTKKIPRNHEMRRLNDSFYPTYYSKRRARLLDDQRPLSYRNLLVGVEQCSFFLVSDSTVISFFESSGDDIDSAILSRISAEETIIRTSCDASILLQSIIDAIVDITYPVLTAYRKRLSEFELDILINPDLKHTQTLHLMSGELAKLRRTILPTSSMINQMKDFSKATKHPDSQKVLPRLGPVNSSHSLITPLTEVYLADIVDHTMMFTDEIEEMMTKVDNLVALLFNTISTDTNEAMKQLSLVTVIFLPLSFWTGYYGMNFEKFGDLKESVSYYWKIAVPFSAGLMILITYSFSFKSFIKWKRLLKKKWADVKTNRDMKKRIKSETRHERLIRRSKERAEESSKGSSKSSSANMV